MSGKFAFTCPEITTEVRGRVGFITLNRPHALNALSLAMIRTLVNILLSWREDVTPEMVAPFFISPWPAHAHPPRELG